MTGALDLLRLAPGVYYEKYGEGVYLRCVDTRKDYLFNDIVCDLLDCFSKTEPHSAAKAVETVLSQYEAEDEASFRQDMDDFLRLLIDEGILEEPAPEPMRDTAVKHLVEQQCSRERRLFSLGLELTYRCNERCVHCYVDGPPDSHGELTLDEYRKLLDEARAMGCISLLLTGGEVCCKRDFPEIAEYAASIGMLVDIYTNGLAVTDELFDRICALKPNSMSFSLYGGHAELHDAITQVKGSFDRTLKLVMMTKCAGIDTYIKTVVLRENVNDLEPLFQLGKRIGVDVAPTYTILDTHTGVSSACHRLETAEEYRTVMEMIRRYHPKSLIRDDRDPVEPACGSGQCSLCVDPYGEIYPCLALRTSLGNVRRRSIQDVWQNSPELERIRQLRFKDLCPGCGTCSYVGSCDICMGRLSQGGHNVPEDVCMISKASFLTRERITERREHNGEA